MKMLQLVTLHVVVLLIADMSQGKKLFILGKTNKTQSIRPNINASKFQNRADIQIATNVSHINISKGLEEKRGENKTDSQFIAKNYSELHIALIIPPITVLIAVMLVLFFCVCNDKKIWKIFKSKTTGRKSSRESEQVNNTQGENTIMMDPILENG